MTRETFWKRYFFRVYQIGREEEKRKALLRGIFLSHSFIINNTTIYFLYQARSRLKKISVGKMRKKIPHQQPREHLTPASALCQMARLKPHSVPFQIHWESRERFHHRSRPHTPVHGRVATKVMTFFHLRMTVQTRAREGQRRRRMETIQTVTGSNQLLCTYVA